jgi:hypothetical protein
MRGLGFDVLFFSGLGVDSVILECYVGVKLRSI